MHGAESPGQFTVREMVHYLRQTNWRIGGR